MSFVPKEDSIEIREVWNDNLEEEIALIEQAIDDFPYVAMDTEFPGTVCKLVSANPNPNPRGDDFNPRCYKFNYESVKTNVNMLKLIQLGLTLSDEQGNLPTCGTNKQCVWQFNFREFNLRSDIYAIDSIELLSTSGIDFTKNNQFGVESKRFAELLTGSGVVLNDNVQWVTFHCGYDFGYLLKLLTGNDLPEEQSKFFVLVKTFFPRVYDIKYMMDFCSLYGGLSKVAERLHVERVGVAHQAGSDSLLTSHVFRKMKDTCFPGSIDEYSGFLYGLGDANSQLLLITEKKI